MFDCVKEMRREAKVMGITTVLLFLSLLTLSCSQTHPVSSWERHCEACHDGKTALNGKVVIGKEEMKRERYLD